MPPGTMYDANHQCRLQYGSDDAEICTNEQVLECLNQHSLNSLSRILCFLEQKSTAKRIFV
jgi:hypothetical protein